ncbi:MAG: DNA-directed DNA polymerase, delta prime subunit [Candidatus Uhrbacteria bacterium GW2011_GWF2_41_16]|uniref:DNA-directed DNA polymerase, delta prime subunit n=2 Tax=Candidatus Uhriibacteriota TaxID=1752732 RepID=A0A0G0VD37_9BACT|nr:MAG: DNA-directed DNA polymerase, delta prime subunit [Candidatus Uhrbacteria bacterium GW2011_GWA2_41_10]KKR87860.1 MAG: DNA-directed DNA polymerase, delta prime subunit [Candidatus Uhrbacteria bacterium GW2011_GWC2_41_11]KKR98799.1 MAG: DNA-directed DNA polymerase, delta prime subunit [Candidatus Uhrbacteria bacterium GW2011_GWF2_41_16]HBP00358.1 hypothetical protein [Candidatus Uhrbacteria bacterium]
MSSVSESSTISVIGQERVIAFLERAAAADRLSHAYLFVGPEGVGKTTVIHWFLQTLFPEGLAHPDISFVRRLSDEKTGKIKSAITVEQIRTLRERLGMSAFLGGYKAAVIEEADVLNLEASNALLKLLEEPTVKTILMLRATSPEQLLPTLVSRCQILRCPFVSEQKMIHGLEIRGIHSEEAKKMARISHGCPGRAFRFLENPEERIQEEKTCANLMALLQKPLSERLVLAAEQVPKEEANRIESLLHLLNIWEWMLRDLFLISSGIEKNYAEFFGEIFVSLAKSRSPNQWSRILKVLRKIRIDFSSHVNPQLAIEHLFLSF